MIRNETTEFGEILQIRVCSRQEVTGVPPALLGDHVSSQHSSAGGMKHLESDSDISLLPFPGQLDDNFQG